MLSKIDPSFQFNYRVPISDEKRRDADETDYESFAPTFATIIMFGGDHGKV
jgi:hypothetical protein